MLSRLHLLFLLFSLPLMGMACQSEPRTEYLLEVTREVTVVVVVTATPDADAPPTVLETSVASGQTIEPQAVTELPTATTTPLSEPTITAEPTFDPRPTPTMNRVIVAEQRFERGRMFYLQPIQQIWVMIENGDPNTGPWRIEEDTWDESLPEIDEDLEPPREGLFQPRRGFGKLWRDNDDIQQALGWAINEEVGRVATYQYFPGGDVDAGGTYIPGPGVHTLDSHYGGTYLFDERTSTWGLAAVTPGE